MKTVLMRPVSSQRVVSQGGLRVTETTQIVRRCYGAGGVGCFE
jgi:hypothetical protein